MVSARKGTSCSADASPRSSVSNVRVGGVGGGFVFGCVDDAFGCVDDVFDHVNDVSGCVDEIFGCVDLDGFLGSCEDFVGSWEGLVASASTSSMDIALDTLDTLRADTDIDADFFVSPVPVRASFLPRETGSAGGPIVCEGATSERADAVRDFSGLAKEKRARKYVPDVCSLAVFNGCLEAEFLSNDAFSTKFEGMP